jgi:hypothetical protein
MKVMAKAMGQYRGRMYNAGDVFDISDEQVQVLDAHGKPLKDEQGNLVKRGLFSDKWMEKFDEAKDKDLRAKAKEVNKKAAEQEAKQKEKAEDEASVPMHLRTRNTAKEAEEQLVLAPVDPTPLVSTTSVAGHEPVVLEQKPVLEKGYREDGTYEG